MTQNNTPENDLFAPLEEQAAAVTNAATAVESAPETAPESAAETSSGPAEGGEPVHADNEVAAKPKKKKKKKKKAPEKRGLMARFHELVSEEDAPINLNINIKALVSGESVPTFFRKNLGFVIVCFTFALVYITCGYARTQLRQQENALRADRKDRFYKVLTVRSQLYEQTLSSKIEQNLRDSTLHTSTDQAFTVVVEEE